MLCTPCCIMPVMTVVLLLHHFRIPQSTRRHNKMACARAPAPPHPPVSGDDPQCLVQQGQGVSARDVLTSATVQGHHGQGLIMKGGVDGGGQDRLQGAGQHQAGDVCG
jgi:hypothetical protein